MVAARKPELCVEVLYKNLYGQAFVPKKTISDDVYQWLTVDSEILGLRLDTLVPVPDPMSSLRNAERIESIKVTDFAGPTETQPEDFKVVRDVQLSVFAYELHSTPKQSPSDSRASLHASSEGPWKLTVLPNRDLARTWDSLVFTSFDPSQTLRSIARIVELLREPDIDLDILNPNRVVLLYGPPGCGKTTLCRALAQKLTIRLGHHFHSGRLFEINTQALSSKYYSESGKLVCQMFDKVLALAKDEKELICVIIDEVESIAGSREQLSENGDCYDSIRATNQLLTALDRIRYQPNVIILCTSNLHQAIDPAFIDRLDYEIEIPSLGNGPIYEILRSTVNELIRSKFISNEPYPYPEDVAALVDDSTYLPSYDRVPSLHKYPDVPATVLARIAEDCIGLSGRRLRKLPLLAIFTYTWGGSCSLKDALEALQMAVEQGKSRKSAPKDLQMAGRD